ncbi:MAG TPA: hypothetical protein VLM11_04260 [Streptosporangiaceae bacterium]|nr:hypothetical protein [Streptosporangiaceae bacterium]
MRRESSTVVALVGDVTGDLLARVRRSLSTSARSVPCARAGLLWLA